MSKRERDERDIWDSKDVADYLGCSEPHVTKMANTQGLPHMRLGRLWRFRRADVLAWELEQVQKAVAS